MNDKLNGADAGAHDRELPDEPETQDATQPEPAWSDPAGPTGAPGPTSASGASAPGGRFGIRRGRTRAEERIAELDTSPTRLTA